MKKILSFTFVVTMLSIFFTMCVSAETVFETEKIIKCEDINNAAMTPTVYDDSLGSRVYYTAGGFLSDPQTIIEPQMSFKFNIPEDGNYTMYVRGVFPTTGSDSFYYKFDESEWVDMHPNDRGQRFVWFVVSNNTYFTAGEHNFYWHYRESGSYFDCFSIIKSDGEFKVIIEGTTLETDTQPYIENGVSMVPFRALGEALGATVKWNSEERSATISTDRVSLKVVENSGEAYFGNFPIKLESPARIINGRFMVPVRFVANNLQYDVNWFPNTNHAFITKK